MDIGLFISKHFLNFAMLIQCKCIARRIKGYYGNNYIEKDDLVPFSSIPA